MTEENVVVSTDDGIVPDTTKSEITPDIKKDESAENVRMKSLMFEQSTGLFMGPCLARPMNSATAVLTPAMVRTPLGTSSM